MDYDNEFLRGVLDGISDSIKIIDSSFNVVFANAPTLEDAGKSLAEVSRPGAKCFEEFYNNDDQCSYCVVHQVFNSGLPVFNVYQTRNGKEARTKEISAFPLAGKGGEVEHVIEIVRDVTELKKELVHSAEFSSIISQDPKMEEVFDVIKSVAATSSTVLVYGETGTGKELVARAIHQNSKRADKRLVSINCGAVPETLLETELFGHEKGSFTGADQRRIGKFELADKGTLFLDEIGDISMNMQVKILRALQEGEITRVGGSDQLKIDVRFICATNADLEEAVKKGEFREDLYYRINVVPITLPPLRDRGSDVVVLAEHYLEKFRAEIGKDLRGFSATAINQMKRHNWPGNVRELRNLVERAVILSKGQHIEKLAIPEKNVRAGDPIDGGYTMKDAADAAEREYLIQILRSNKGNINKTAENAGVNTRTVHRKMKDFHINKEDFK